MDAILISWDPEPDEVEEVKRHLDHYEYYWRVRFRIASSRFTFPMVGYVHMKGRRVEYMLTIADIVPFSPAHYELAAPVIPKLWIREWNETPPNERIPWKNELVITKIEPFSFDTYLFRKYDDTPVKHPPEGFTRVLPPGEPTKGQAEQDPT